MFGPKYVFVLWFKSISVHVFLKFLQFLYFTDCLIRFSSGEKMCDSGHDHQGVKCRDCELSLEKKRHFCARHAKCFESQACQWDPSKCSLCLKFFGEADASEDEQEAKQILIYFARKAKGLPATYPDKLFFESPEVKSKFFRKWFSKTLTFRPSKDHPSGFVSHGFLPPPALVTQSSSVANTEPESVPGPSNFPGALSGSQSVFGPYLSKGNNPFLSSFALLSQENSFSVAQEQTFSVSEVPVSYPSVSISPQSNCITGSQTSQNSERQGSQPGLQEAERQRLRDFISKKFPFFGSGIQTAGISTSAVQVSGSSSSIPNIALPT